ncbi:MAG: type II toxin-antitoxin system VapC family toxin [Dehalococcoidia bacterium]|nr:type II toxin-antitoxin system VapC family toxin [Dehalococcoidia bacterium]
MRYLLDTHAFLWWIMADPRLSTRAMEIVRDAGNEIWFSAASAWEIAIKARLGRITFAEDPVSFIPRQIAANGFKNLVVENEHALFVCALPLLHRDPFDRLLIAQASVEKMMLLTADRAFAMYDVPVVW